MEIEHKYVLPPDTEVDAFRKRVASLGAYSVSLPESVDDYTCAARPDRVVRVRRNLGSDEVELCVKSRGADAEVRLEEEVPVPEWGAAPLPRFLSALGWEHAGRVEKSSVAFRFEDCEVAVYSARTGDRTALCLEVEAVGVPDAPAALAVVARYEAALGLDPGERERRSLADLLLPAFGAAL